MRRRVFLVYGLCLGGIGRHTWAQGAGDLPRVGILSPDPAAVGRDRLAAFLATLREFGDVDGRNVRFDIRFAENHLDRLPALAAELVKARPAAIYTYTTAGAFAAAGATTSIPIIVGPVAERTMEHLAGNFAKPGANVTGYAFEVENQSEKCLQLLKETAPALSRIGVLLNPDSPNTDDVLIASNAAAKQLGLVLVRIESRGSVDIDRTLSHYTNGTVDAILLVDDSTLAGDTGVRARVIEFARQQHLPSASVNTTYARDGGLLSLGTDMYPIFRGVAAEYVHRIIHGARPNELPVQLSTKLELVINLKTAKLLDLTIPPSILGVADEVIE
jgi:putative ABC transport system substrate-binding protein